MNKIKEIILSYAASVNPTDEQKELAEIRLKSIVWSAKHGQKTLWV